MQATLKAIKMLLRKRMHDPIERTGAWMRRLLQGYLNYFAVSGNDPSLWWFYAEGALALAEDAKAAKPEFTRLTDCFFPPIKVLHPLPCHRFDAKTRGRRPVR